MARNTKASRILNDSARRVEIARTRKDIAQAQLNEATAALDALRDAHDALEKELTPKPRKKPTPPPAPAQKDLPTEKAVLCGACGNAEGYQDHFPPSPHFHEFVAPKVKKAVK